jgi:hypothetical protein
LRQKRLRTKYEVSRYNPFLVVRGRHLTVKRGVCTASAWQRVAAATIERKVRQNRHTAA